MVQTLPTATKPLFSVGLTTSIGELKPDLSPQVLFVHKAEPSNPSLNCRNLISCIADAHFKQSKDQNVSSLSSVMWLAFFFVAKICKLVCELFSKCEKKWFLGFSDCQNMKINFHFQINMLKKIYQVLHYLLGFIHNNCKNLVAKHISPLYFITSTRGYPNGFNGL
jgi:hypothetical protein